MCTHVQISFPQVPRQPSVLPSPRRNQRRCPDVDGLSNTRFRAATLVKHARFVNVPVLGLPVYEHAPGSQRLNHACHLFNRVLRWEVWAIGDAPRGVDGGWVRSWDRIDNVGKVLFGVLLPDETDGCIGGQVSVAPHVGVLSDAEPEFAGAWPAMGLVEDTAEFFILGGLDEDGASDFFIRSRANSIVTSASFVCGNTNSEVDDTHNVDMLEPRRFRCEETP